MQLVSNSAFEGRIVDDLTIRGVDSDRILLSVDAPELDGSHLVQSTLERLRPFFENAKQLAEELQAEGKFRRRGSRQLPEHQAYDVEVFQRCAAISTTFDRLGDTERFIQRLPRFAELRDEGLPPQRWILYHYSFHAVLVTSLLDLAVLLTNTVLRLGYVERRCSYEALAENAWVKRHGLGKRLLAIRKATGKHREKRNLFVHRGEDIDIGQELESDTYDMLTLAASAGTLLKMKTLEDHVVDLLFASELTTLVEKMEIERKELIPPMLV